MMNLLKAESLPSWFRYPAGLVALVESGNIDYGPWQLLHGEWLEVRHNGLKKRFPALELVPFARRLDNDDVACFDVSDVSLKVKIIHDFASPGWEGRGEFENFEAWLVAAREAALEWD